MRRRTSDELPPAPPEDADADEDEDDAAAAPKKPQRNWRLEAALVRTMKADKVLPERQLIDKAMEVCKKMFVPEIKDVKRCIENLIKKGYMERTEEDKKVIKYKS